MIRFVCACGTHLRAEDTVAGQVTHCPQCGAVVKVPQPEAGPGASSERSAQQPVPALGDVAKAELLRRAGGRCGRCGARLNLVTAQFHRKQATPPQGSAGDPDWEVLCLPCLGRARILVTCDP
jgi:DNA-directed RNA polymerase subunit M/transcription elongation factor TFIIS